MGRFPFKANANSVILLIMCRHLIFLIFAFHFLSVVMAQQQVKHPEIGSSRESEDGGISVRLVNKLQNYGGNSGTRDIYINSPKSINIHPDREKFYVNSLEGGNTVVFDFRTNRRISVVSHRFDESHKHLWGDTTALYPFTHYKRSNTFIGKPVESTFSHGGRYLWVPYYRRSYDINAQDPSAVAIIDTRSDSIVRLMDCGPLPKMIATSPDGHYVAIAHWGNNTVGLVDISGENPAGWKHVACFTVDYKLRLDYPTDRSVDRDNGSGYALRGTVFTPDSRFLLIGCMGGGGGIAVIDMRTQKYLGRVLGMMNNVRHLLIKGDYLYLSINGAGYVQRTSLKAFTASIGQIKNGKSVHSEWESCKVGAGARTIVVSPSGRYVFAACNNVSLLCVVDTRSMKMVASIETDSYPVGMDISDDGRYIYTTSQGRERKGGNAVDIYEVTYREPEPTNISATAPVYPSISEQQPSASALRSAPDESKEPERSMPTKPLTIFAIAAVAVIAGIVYVVRRRK